MRLAIVPPQDSFPKLRPDVDWLDRECLRLPQLARKACMDAVIDAPDWSVQVTPSD